MNILFFFSKNNNNYNNNRHAGTTWILDASRSHWQHALCIRLAEQQQKTRKSNTDITITICSCMWRTTPRTFAPSWTAQWAVRCSPTLRCADATTTWTRGTTKMSACTRQPTAIQCSSTRGSSPTAPTNTCCRSTPTCRPRPRRPRLVPRRRRRQPTRRCQRNPLPLPFVSFHHHDCYYLLIVLRLVLRLLITNRACRPPVASVNGLRCPNVHVVGECHNMTSRN